MKSRLLSVIKCYVITYANGVECRYSLTDGELSYKFLSPSGKILYYVSNKEFLLTKLPYSCDKYAAYLTITKVKELENFTDFDKLICFNGPIDGTNRDCFDNVISSILKYDDIFCAIYLKIDTRKKVTKYYSILKNHPFVQEIKKIDIPYYNINKQGHDKTISMIVKLPIEIYKEYCGNEYVTDTIKTKIFKEVLMNKV
jgi:hypothetical protein